MTAKVLADIAASVLRVEVKVGDPVALGQVLLVLESMKMEMPVLASRAGRVAELGVRSGDTVLEGDLLAVIDETSHRQGETTT